MSDDWGREESAVNQNEKRKTGEERKRERKKVRNKERNKEKDYI